MKSKALRHPTALLPGFWLVLCLLYLGNADVVRDSVQRSIMLCGSALIPSLFPVLVFSGALVASENVTREKTRRALEILGRPLLLGWIFGFPVGAMQMEEALKTWEGRRPDRLLYLSCGTSATFVIAFVGGHLLKDPVLGVLLYLSELLPLLMFSAPILWSQRKRLLPSLTQKRGPVSFAEVIRRASLDMLSICGCVMFFGSVADLFLFHLPETLAPFFLSVTEVGSAASRLTVMRGPLARPLLGFSVGFGGLSALLQMLPHVKKAGGSPWKLLWWRLVLGALSAGFFFLFSTVRGS